MWQFKEGDEKTDFTLKLHVKDKKKINNVDFPMKQKPKDELSVRPT